MQVPDSDKAATNTMGSTVQTAASKDMQSGLLYPSAQSKHRNAFQVST